MNNKIWLLLFSVLLLQACRHPLQIQGEGDIVDLNGTGRGCTLEESLANDPRCSENGVEDGRYQVEFEPRPREGWVFKEWAGETTCAPVSEFPNCFYNLTPAWYQWWIGYFPTWNAKPTIAVFVENDLAFYQSKIKDPVVNQHCIGCHVPGGLAEDSGFMLNPNVSEAQDRDNVEFFRTYIELTNEGRSQLLGKVRGGAGHGGGPRLNHTEPSFRDLEVFLEMIDPNTPRQPTPNEIFYQQNVEVIIKDSCISCHAINAGGGGSLLLDEYDSEFNALNNINLIQNISKDTFLDKASGGAGHAGGAAVIIDSAEYNALAQLMDLINGAAPPPPPAIGDFYADYIKQPVEAICSQCHVWEGVASGSPLSLDMEPSANQDNNNIWTFENLVNNFPAGRELIEAKITGGLNHTGGAVMPAGSENHTRMLEFLELLDYQDANGDSIQGHFDWAVSDQVVEGICIDCHQPGGLSADTRLVFDPTEGPLQSQNHAQVLINYIETVENGRENLLYKIRGMRAHGGGTVLAPPDSRFYDLEYFLQIAKTTPEPWTAADRYYSQHVYWNVVNENCSQCHVPGGAAQDTRLVLDPDYTSSAIPFTRKVFADFVNTVPLGRLLIAEKALGNANHGGGQRLQPDEWPINTLRQFLVLVDDTPPAPPATNQETEYYLQFIKEPVVESRCIACHIDGGLSGETRLIFDNELTLERDSNNIGALQQFINTVDDGRALLLSKVTGGDAHGGGEQLQQSSETYGHLGNLLALLDETPPQAPDDQQTFFDDHLAAQVLDASCLGCHVEGGLSENTRLVFEGAAGDTQTSANIFVLQNFIESVNNGSSIILSKVLGGNGHGGGPQLTSSSNEYQKLEEFLGIIDDTPVIPLPPLDLDSFWNDVQIASPSALLRRAALILAGRLPTDGEIALAESGDAGLRSALRGLMQGERFHEFLVEGSNDRLLTKGFLDSSSLAFEAFDFNFPYLPELATRAQQARSSLDENTLNAFYQFWNAVSYGGAMSPLELIAHVAENDLPYTEILTADYVMVNPQLSAVYRSGVLQGTSDPQLFEPGTNRGQMLTDETFTSNYTEAFGLEIFTEGPIVQDFPHAGILNTHAYLSRYPTTETNRNRARSRWTYQHFLDLDIEKSAGRTTNPVALADTNNPTLNNPNCAVCHRVMDPVAGTFQNYGNSGHFRTAYGGLDALPDTYKYPEPGADPTPYEYGDTWFRTHRAPGFNGYVAPSNDNSLQWVAQEIISDDRFAVSSIKFWWPALMGNPPLEAPEVAADADSLQRLRAYERQAEDINALADAFRTGINGGPAYNLKDVLVEMMITPWFRASGITPAALPGRELELEGVGIRRLLNPRELNNKNRAVLGRAWNEYYAEWDVIDQTYSELLDNYRIYFGGIDSGGITERARQLTALMYSVAELQAFEMACGITITDFNRPDAERDLFRGIDRFTTPYTEAASTFEVTPPNPGSALPYSVDVNLSAGNKTLSVGFLNDYADEFNDRNLWIDRVEFYGPGGGLVASYEGNQLSALPDFQASNGNASGDDWIVYSVGGFNFTFNAASAGDYRVVVVAYGQLAGPENPLMTVQVSGQSAYDNTAGEQLLRSKLVELHHIMLGEQLQVNDTEINESYNLLVEIWNERKVRLADYDWFEGPGEACNIVDEQGDLLYAINNWGNDPGKMIGSWITVMVYLMTDFNYLHE